MLTPRVIPCLLLEEGGLVKTIRFKRSTYVGDPINAIKIFNDKRVDELILLDIAASKEGRGPDYELLARIATECFMPLGYGGGISSVQSAKRVIKLGLEKIAVNHAALRRPSLVSELAHELGSQSVIASIDVKRHWRGGYRVYDSASKRVTGIEPLGYAEQLVEMGAGEVMLTSVDRDGTQRGYDEDLVRRFTSRLTTPVIACGGAWSREHLRSVVLEAGASAAAAGSMFVFQGPHRAVLISYPPPHELMNLMRHR